MNFTCALIVIIVVVAVLYKSRVHHRSALPPLDEAVVLTARRNTHATNFHPSEWSWLYVQDGSTWEAVHGSSLPPGVYASPAINQHSNGWCGICFLAAVVGAVADQLCIRDAPAEPDLLDHRAYKFDLQLAADNFTKLFSPKVKERESVGIALTSRQRSSWNACQGGNPEDVLEALTDGSLKLTLERPHTLFLSTADGSRAREAPKGYSIRGWRILDLTLTELKRAVWRSPVVLTIASEPLWSIKNGEPTDCTTSKERNHVVVVVGWTTEHWIIRNSWGVPGDLVFTPPHDIRRCTAAAATRPECRSSAVQWHNDFEEGGFLKIPIHFDKNCCGIYSEPSGWYEIFV